MLTQCSKNIKCHQLLLPFLYISFTATSQERTTITDNQQDDSSSGSDEGNDEHKEGEGEKETEQPPSITGGN